MLSNGYHLSSRCSTAEDEGDICCVFLLALSVQARALQCFAIGNAVSPKQPLLSHRQEGGERKEPPSASAVIRCRRNTNGIFTGTLQGCDQTEAEAPLMSPGSGLGLTTALSVSPNVSLICQQFAGKLPALLSRDGAALLMS